MLGNHPKGPTPRWLDHRGNWHSVAKKPSEKGRGYNVFFYKPQDVAQGGPVPVNSYDLK